jgi:hypothetical protein
MRAVQRRATPKFSAFPSYENRLARQIAAGIEKLGSTSAKRGNGRAS